ncbi:MAG: sensor histidine kinase [Propionibacteriaceae bacterium]
MTRLVTTTTPRRFPRVVLRSTWVLLGSAIGIATIGLIISAAPFLHEVFRIPYAVVIPLLVLGIPAIGLLPGIRELEVTAASTLLDLRSELIIPEVLRPEHRWRSAVWVTAHLVLSAIVVVVLVLVMPMMWYLTLSRVGLPVEAGPSFDWLPNVHEPGETGLVLLLGIPATVLACGALWLVGVISARLAPAYLGPTHADRLEVARQRLDLEAEHTRLARELHDGIGHALSIISLQAVAGRRLIDRDPDRAGESLATIETTARSATDDLDRTLGLLHRRESEQQDTASARREPDPGLDRAPILVRSHRAAGMAITADLDPALVEDQTLPILLSSSAYRVLSEALTNAHKHAGPGEVSVVLRAVATNSTRVGGGLDKVTPRSTRDHRSVEIIVASPLATRARPRSRQGGRGIRGMTERVALFDGSLTAAPAGELWRIRAVLPIPTPEPTPRTQRTEERP